LSADQDGAQALAVLLSDHATHFAWLLRDPAIAIIARGLRDGYTELSQTISQALHHDVPDDVVEALGRCVDVSGMRGDASQLFTTIRPLLGSHDNQFVRDLSDDPGDDRHPLPARYLLDLPSGAGPIVGVGDVRFGPYEGVVRTLAAVSGRDGDMLMEHARQQ